ncbi:hypothetical protein [Proteiniphilum acetatigenes]|nr:hypothetical protein [Proteiniphilum acetatigenes]SFK63410.1 hypothetical protein SAMN05216357_10420 [Porphyromonadaceae bacterium KH3CP3RA]
MKTEKEQTTGLREEKQYQKPAIEIIEMELEQPVLAGSTPPDMPGGDW